jgi:cation transport ATPase
VQGALLLLLFQLSHTLEERFTTRARGNLERLFADLPRKATVVDVDPETGAPLLHGKVKPQPAAGVHVGQHVLVNPGENVGGWREVISGFKVLKHTRILTF